MRTNLLANYSVELMGEISVSPWGLARGRFIEEVTVSHEKIPFMSRISATESQRIGIQSPRAQVRPEKHAFAPLVIQ